ncbi:MAG: class I tRNA ligase family protein, partial [Anaerolineales bacterium]
LTGSTPGNDMKLSLSRVESNRNFANKLWQAARFVLGNLGDRAASFVPPATLDPATLTNTADRWIVSRFHGLVAEVDRLFTAYQLGEAGRQIYDFVWGEYCDWYIEMSKVRLRGQGGPDADQALQVLVYVLEGCLTLLHPYMPFVTEAIWQYLPHEGEALIVADWPRGTGRDEQAEADLAALMELVRAIRNVRSEYEVETSRRIGAVIAAGERLPLLQEQREALELLARIDPAQLTLVAALDSHPAQTVGVVAGGFEGYLPLAALVDLEAERERVAKQLAELAAEVARSEKLLSNPNFIAKAKPEVVEHERAKLADLRERQAKLDARRQALA